MKRVEDKFKSAFPKRHKEQTRETTRQRMDRENRAARKVQSVYRKHLLSLEKKILRKTRTLTLRAREKNLAKLEELVLTLWVTSKRRDPSQVYQLHTDPAAAPPDDGDNQDREADAEEMALESVNG